MFNPQFKEMKDAHKTPFMFILSAIDGYKKFAIFKLFYSIFFASLKISISLSFALMVNYFSTTDIADFSYIHGLYLLGIIFFVMIMINLNRFFNELISERVRQTVVWRVMDYACSYAMGHSARYLKEQKSGELAQRVVNLGNIMFLQLLSFARINSCFWQIVIPLIIIAKTNIFFLAITLLFGIVSMFLSFKISHKLTELNQQDSACYNSFIGYVTDTLSNILLIKMFGKENVEEEKVHRELIKVSEIKQITSFKTMILNGLQDIWLIFFKLSGLYVALYLWKANLINITDGVLVLLLFDDIIMLFNRFLVDTTLVRNNLGKVADAIKFIEQPYDIIDRANAKPLRVKNGAITFENISFSYDSEKNIFDNFNLEIKAKEKLGIVGRSGAGKSTLIELLMRSYDIKKGKILIDGQDISLVKNRSLKKEIAVVSQEHLLFCRSIKRNIGYGNHYSFKKIKDASISAYADNFIKTAEYGYLTLAGEKGIKLSGGECQRIAIARAIIKQSPIIILDEATSALDNKTENDVINGLDNLMKDKTVIAIAHRLSTLKNMDRIIVIDKGKIVESGTPKDLLDKDGKFAKLWKLQKG